MCIVQQNIFYLNITSTTHWHSIQMYFPVPGLKIVVLAVGPPLGWGPQATAPSAYPLIRHCERLLLSLTFVKAAEGSFIMYVGWWPRVAEALGGEGGICPHKTQSVGA